MMPDSGCVVKSGGMPCGVPGRVYFLGCVHEHAGQRELCEGHAAVMAGTAWCVQCRESREPHDCLVLLREVARAG